MAASHLPLLTYGGRCSAKGRRWCGNAVEARIAPQAAVRARVSTHVHEQSARTWWLRSFESLKQQPGHSPAVSFSTGNPSKF